MEDNFPKWGVLEVLVRDLVIGNGRFGIRTHRFGVLGCPLESSLVLHNGWQ